MASFVGAKTVIGASSQLSNGAARPVADSAVMRVDRSLLADPFSTMVSEESARAVVPKPRVVAASTAPTRVFLMFVVLLGGFGGFASARPTPVTVGTEAWTVQSCCRLSIGGERGE